MAVIHSSDNREWRKERDCEYSLRIYYILSFFLFLVCVAVAVDSLPNNVEPNGTDYELRIALQSVAELYRSKVMRTSEGDIVYFTHSTYREAIKYINSAFLDVHWHTLKSIAFGWVAVLRLFIGRCADALMRGAKLCAHFFLCALTSAMEKIKMSTLNFRVKNKKKTMERTASL